MAEEIFYKPYHWEANYNYAHGGQSRFFFELRDNARLMGTRCPKCEKVWYPPEAFCHDCFVPTVWVEIGPEGTVFAATIVYQSSTDFQGEVPFIAAFIELEGASTRMFHRIVAKEMAKVGPGTRVRAVFEKERTGDVGRDFYFVPVDEL